MKAKEGLIAAHKASVMRKERIKSNLLSALDLIKFQIENENFKPASSLLGNCVTYISDVEWEIGYAWGIEVATKQLEGADTDGN